MDGDLKTFSGTLNEAYNWWSVDMQADVVISQIECFLSKKVHSHGYYANFTVETRTTETDDWLLCWKVKDPVPPISPYVVRCRNKLTVARYLRISVNVNNLYLYEVQVRGVNKYGEYSPVPNCKGRVR